MAHFFTGGFKNIKPLAFTSLQLIYNFIKFQAADPDCAWYCTFKISTGFWGLISYILVRPDISIVILLTVTDILSKPYEVFSTANATKIEYVNFKRVEIVVTNYLSMHSSSNSLFCTVIPFGATNFLMVTLLRYSCTCFSQISTLLRYCPLIPSSMNCGSPSCVLHSDHACTLFWT